VRVGIYRFADRAEVTRAQNVVRRIDAEAAIERRYQAALAKVRQQRRAS
jgi:hypothetical protein